MLRKEKKFVLAENLRELAPYESLLLKKLLDVKPPETEKKRIPQFQKYEGENILFSKWSEDIKIFLEQFSGFDKNDKTIEEVLKEIFQLNTIQNNIEFPSQTKSIARKPEENAEEFAKLQNYHDFMLVTSALNRGYSIDVEYSNFVQRMNDLGIFVKHFFYDNDDEDKGSYFMLILPPFYAKFYVQMFQSIISQNEYYQRLFYSTKPISFQEIDREIEKARKNEISWEKFLKKSPAIRDVLNYIRNDLSQINIWKYLLSYSNPRLGSVPNWGFQMVVLGLESTDDVTQNYERVLQDFKNNYEDLNVIYYIFILILRQLASVQLLGLKKEMDYSKINREKYFSALENILQGSDIQHFGYSREGTEREVYFPVLKLEELMLPEDKYTLSFIEKEDEASIEGRLATEEERKATKITREEVKKRECAYGIVKSCEFPDRLLMGIIEPRVMRKLIKNPRREAIKRGISKDFDESQVTMQQLIRMAEDLQITLPEGESLKTITKEKLASLIKKAI